MWRFRERGFWVGAQQVQSAWVWNRFGVGGTAGSCLDGHVPGSRLGRWVVTVLLLYIVLIPIILSRGRKTVGKYLQILARTVGSIFSTFKLCLVLNHCF